MLLSVHRKNQDRRRPVRSEVPVDPAAQAPGEFACDLETAARSNGRLRFAVVRNLASDERLREQQFDANCSVPAPKPVAGGIRNEFRYDQAEQPTTLGVQQNIMFDEYQLDALVIELRPADCPAHTSEIRANVNAGRMLRHLQSAVHLHVMVEPILYGSQRGLDLTIGRTRGGDRNGANSRREVVIDAVRELPQQKALFRKAPLEAGNVT